MSPSMAVGNRLTLYFSYLQRPSSQSYEVDESAAHTLTASNKSLSNQPSPREKKKKHEVRIERNESWFYIEIIEVKIYVQCVVSAESVITIITIIIRVLRERIFDISILILFFNKNKLKMKKESLLGIFVAWVFLSPRTASAAQHCLAFACARPQCWTPNWDGIWSRPSNDTANRVKQICTTRYYYRHKNKSVLRLA